MSPHPFITVIIPVHNGENFLPRCLDRLLTSSYPAYEIIIVNDASTDQSAEIARQKGARVLATTRQSGPAAARNLGATQARGELLFFVDADVMVQPLTLDRIAYNFRTYPEIAAVFGSYDDSPAEKNFLSQYRNLYHHYVHQQARPEASTFWSGCGAIRRDVFLALGGFDQVRYPAPAIEDIELGYRLRRKGYNIRLDKELQVKHLKEWRLGSMLRADIFARALPWSTLILETDNLVNDLNLQMTERINAGMVMLSVGVLLLSPWQPKLLLILPLLLAVPLLLNRKLYRFFLQRKGWGFTLLVFPLQLLYYLYSSLTFLCCWGKQFFSNSWLRLQGTQK
jgi:glycosyltransferase involved in cell wall biosynthesis